jgi:hypothetical protein
LDPRVGEKSDRTGERAWGPGRPAKYIIGRRKAAIHKEDIKKNVVPATKPKNTGNLDTSPLDRSRHEHMGMGEVGQRQTGRRDVAECP